MYSFQLPRHIISSGIQLTWLGPLDPLVKIGAFVDAYYVVITINFNGYFYYGPNVLSVPTC